MIYLGYVILSASTLLLLNALMNLIFRANYSGCSSQVDELISVIIPARNEEENIGNILDDLRNQSYSNIEILIYDDESTDRTNEIVASKQEIDPRIQLIKATTLPADWLGKNHACYKSAKKSTGKYLLFVDADVRMGKRVVDELIGYLQKSHSGMISVFPKQVMVTQGEKMVTPIMNYILLTLLPLFAVRHVFFSSMAAANGQVMLYDATVYKTFEPHQRFRNEKVEDIHIARFLKKNKQKIACITGNDDLTCRMYKSYDEAMEGFSKNVAAFFGNSHLLAALFWALQFFGIIIVAVTLPFVGTVYYVTIGITTRILTSLTSRQRVSENLRFHFSQMANLGLLIARSISKRNKKEYTWKGRNIS